MAADNSSAKLVQQANSGLVPYRSVNLNGNPR